MIKYVRGEFDFYDAKNMGRINVSFQGNTVGPIKKHLNCAYDLGSERKKGLIKQHGHEHWK